MSTEMMFLSILVAKDILTKTEVEQLILLFKMNAHADEEVIFQKIIKLLGE